MEVVTMAAPGWLSHTWWQLSQKYQTKFIENFLIKKFPTNEIVPVPLLTTFMMDLSHAMQLFNIVRHMDSWAADVDDDTQFLHCLRAGVINRSALRKGREQGHDMFVWRFCRSKTSAKTERRRVPRWITRCLISHKHVWPPIDTKGWIVSTGSWYAYVEWPPHP